MESNSEASPAVLNKKPSVLKIIAGRKKKKILHHCRLLYWVNLASHDWEGSYFNICSDDLGQSHFHVESSCSLNEQSSLSVESTEILWYLSWLGCTT